MRGGNERGERTPSGNAEQAGGKPTEGRLRVGYLGPEGTFTHEALLAELQRGEADGAEPIPLPTIYDTVMAVQAGEVERALVPIENSLEGSVNATLDALAIEADSVVIVGEAVQPIRHCLIARQPLELPEIEAIVSHPQATAQCARFIRDRLPHARVMVGSSTAEAVRRVAEQDRPWAALGNRVAAERYGCRVLCADVEDASGNETRFVWLARDAAGGRGGAATRRGGAAADAPLDAGSGAGAGAPAGAREGAPTAAAADAHAGSGADAGAGAGAATGRAWKTAVVFWGAGSEAPGWLVRCLGEFASRQVNLTRIESRPRKQGLGQYMFFVDLEGHAEEPRVRGALEAVGAQVEVLRVLGSFAAARPPGGRGLTGGG